MPDPEKLQTLLYRATDAVRQTPGRRGRFVEIKDADEIVIARALREFFGPQQFRHRIPFKLTRSLSQVISL